MILIALWTSNSLTHLLNSDDTEELNVIRHSPYISDDELLLSWASKQKKYTKFKLRIRISLFRNKK